MFIIKSEDIFTLPQIGKTMECNDRNIETKHRCPICGEHELKYENSIPVVSIFPSSKDFMYCYNCENWIAVI